jgi:hypothetical protein
LDLAGNVAGSEEGHLAVFEKFEEIGLDAASGDIASAFAAGRGQLVDLVEVNNAELGAVEASIGQAHQVPDKVIHISTDVARFAEFGCVGFEKRDADAGGGRADEVGFTDAGGAEEKDVLFLVEGEFVTFAGEADVLEVIAEGDGEDFLRFILADDEAGEVSGQVDGFEGEGRERVGFGGGSKAGATTAITAISGS